MTGKVLDGNPNIVLILILPVAVGVVLLYKAWPILLLIFLLSVAWKLWEHYQWNQWSQKVNPFFNQLIIENQGCLTPVDLSLKANLSGKAAQRFLIRKAEEYGAQHKVYPDKGTVYYFLTASALGSIFDDSEPVSEEAVNPLPSLQSAVTEVYQPPAPAVSAIAQLVELKESRQQIDNPWAESASEKAETPPEANVPEVSPIVAEIPETVREVREERVQEASLEEVGIQETPISNPTPTSIPGKALIQSDLAKRLDLNPSTVARRKSDLDFPEWSQSRDPDGIAWKYVPKTKMFVPVQLN